MPRGSLSVGLNSLPFGRDSYFSSPLPPGRGRADAAELAQLQLPRCRREPVRAAALWGRSGVCMQMRSGRGSPPLAAAGPWAGCRHRGQDDHAGHAHLEDAPAGPAGPAGTLPRLSRCTSCTLMLLLLFTLQSFVEHQ